MGLCCCMRALFSCGERELCFVAVRQLLFVMASLVGEHRLQRAAEASVGAACADFRSCGARA